MTSDTTDISAAETNTENPNPGGNAVTSESADISAAEANIESPESNAVTNRAENSKEGKDSSYPSSTDTSPASTNQRGPNLLRESSVSKIDTTFRNLSKKTMQATELTTRGLTNLTENTTKQLGTALQQSEEVYEKSVFCVCPRFFAQKFPRLFSLLFGVILPLWVLIGISAGFGVLLARYEAPHEQESNHAILESRARLNRTSVNTTRLAHLPVLCYLKYLNETDSAKFEARINEYVFISSNLENRDSANTTNMTDANITAANTTNITDVNITDADLNYTIGDIADERQEELYLFMLKCQREQNAETLAYLEVRDEYGDSAADSLSFNWIRCWPKEKKYHEFAESSIVFLPPDFLIEASRPAQQEATVETEFVRILNEKESACLELGGGGDECFEDALQDASEGAGNVCHKNLEATSWFFFTVMTTVGYGNQAPITFEGRLVIYTAGIASLILFAAVLGSGGYIITAIFDDFISRLPFARFIQHPLIGVVLWGGVWIGCSYSIARSADNWWAYRLPDFDADLVDAMWFAFISTSTIGLGDFFLQPEVMFGRDALMFSVAFLIGFVLLSTFLNKIGEFIFEMLPKRENSLGARLKNTNLIFWHHWPCNKACNDYFRSYLYKEKETVEESSEEGQQEMQQQEERVEKFKSHLPSKILPAPLNTMNPEGKKDMTSLLDEEEIVLNALLESVKQRRTELHSGGGEESIPEVTKMNGVGEEESIPGLVKMVPLMTGALPAADNEKSGFLRQSSGSTLSV